MSVEGGSISLLASPVLTGGVCILCALRLEMYMSLGLLYHCRTNYC